MQQNYTSREAAALFAGDVDSTTVQRAITRGELAASKSGKHRQSPYKIERAELLRWGAERGFSLVNDAGERVDVATGEVLDPDAEPSPVEKATEARARLAGLRVPDARDDEDGFPVAPVASNVTRVLLPSADAGLLEAARRLVQLPESPELWQALRAVLGVGAWGVDA